MKVNFKNIIIGSFLLFALIGCGGGNGDSPSSNNTENVNNSNQTSDGKPILELAKTYSIPTVYGDSNVLLDGDNLILAGGQTGRTTGATHDGSPLFSNKVIKWDLLNGTKQVLEMNATSGHQYDGGDKGSGGRGNMTTVIYKLNNDKYLIAGGFQYVNSIEIADFSTQNVKKIATLHDLTDQSGLNTTSFFVNNQGSAMDNDGNVYWFGFNNGLYASDSIMKFDKTTEQAELLSTKLTMPREQVFAYKLSNDKIILIGGWDGSASTAPDSATRRAEIFDPETLTIQRIADYPAPTTHYSNGSIDKAFDDGNKICTSMWNTTYQYLIQDDQWSAGCDLNITAITNENFHFPDGALQGNYLGKLSNRQIVFINNGRYSSVFSDSINGYPLETNSTIDIYTIK